MNLREEKHWSYGARSTIVATRAQRPFFAYAPVQTDKTAESLAEILREIIFAPHLSLRSWVLGVGELFNPFLLSLVC